MSVSINVSPKQFRQADFVDKVKIALVDTGADPALLILEVTEGLLIDNLHDTIARMLELTALGIRFSIDDFGTGYSSFSYLKRLPLYELKIDKSFVQDTAGCQWYGDRPVDFIDGTASWFARCGRRCGNAGAGRISD
jgi:EAL domain-containing protein (putative c-di-GMP-specific phosphodiesterase class I)